MLPPPPPRPPPIDVAGKPPIYLARASWSGTIHACNQNQAQKMIDVSKWPWRWIVGSIDKPEIRPLPRRYLYPGFETCKDQVEREHFEQLDFEAQVERYNAECKARMRKYFSSPKTQRAFWVGWTAAGIAIAAFCAWFRI